MLIRRTPEIRTSFSASRPARPWTIPSRMQLRSAGALSQKRGGDARALPRRAAGRGQHRGDRRALPVTISSSATITCREYQAPGGGNRQLCLPQTPLPRRATSGATARPARARWKRSSGMSLTSSTAWALWTTFSSSGTSSATRRATASPSAPGAAAPRAASSPTTLGITDVDPIQYIALFRALPKPRAREHAGYRHGLLRPPPRRGHRLCNAQVRRRSRCADRHLRHDGRAHAPSATSAAR